MSDTSLQRQEWRARAACLGVDTEIFFHDSTYAAKAVCRTCVVREECLEYALVNREKFGVWGGRSERERRRMRRARRLPPRTCQRHECRRQFVPAAPNQLFCNAACRLADAGARKVAKARRAG